MKIFKIPRCYRLLKVWLLVIACQTGRLFSELEDVFPQFYSDSKVLENKKNHFSYSLGEKIHNDLSFFEYETPSIHNYWQASQKVSKNPKQLLLKSNHLITPPFSYYETTHPIHRTLNHTGIEQQGVQQERLSSNLSEGKCDTKIIKKYSKPISSNRRLEDALQQPTEILGKQIPNDSSIGLADDIKNVDSQSLHSMLENIHQIPKPIPLTPKAVENVANSENNSQLYKNLQSPQHTGTYPQSTSHLPHPASAYSNHPTSSSHYTSPSLSQSENSGSTKEISINFNNVAMLEYIRFISRISNKNFIFDDEDLKFNVTIVSEEPTTVENLMAALLQELKIRDLSVMEQGNNIIIHRNPRVRSPARIVVDGSDLLAANESELVTRVFRLNTLDPVKASEIIRPLLSEDALIEVLRDTNNLIITDLVTNINKIAQLVGTLDAPNSGISIGQYVVRSALVDSLVDLAYKILQPIAQGNPFVLVPHPASNSIFVVSNSFIVEKALAILQNLDLNEGHTRILSLETLQPFHSNGSYHSTSTGLGGGYESNGQPLIPGNFNSIELGKNSATMPGDTRDLKSGSIGTSSKWTQDLPVGHIERTLFFIYKLRYRKGDHIEAALRKIAESLQLMGTANADFISAINSIQWIESSNALIFTGIAAALEKVKELILEVDVPLRQVFIEMLILDTTITDALTYSVDWINRFGGGTTTGEEGFVAVPSNSGTSSFVSAAQTILPNSTGSCPPVAACPLPVATNFLSAGGFAAGIIGTHLTHNGTRFSSIGALVKAIHTDSKAEIILNPKIITEDNNPAEIFVGGTDRYKTQSITNDLGSLVTNNFQFIDVGTSLKVTP